VGDVAGQVANRIIELVDLDRMLQNVDLDEVLKRVDLNALLEDVDVDALIKRVDVDDIIDRVDVDRIVQRVDVDAIVARVDVDAIVARVDVNRILADTDMGRMVAQSTGSVFTEILYLVRRQLVGVDAILARLVTRVLGRRGEVLPSGPAATVAAGQAGTQQGHYGGSLARLLAYAIDASLSVTLFGLGLAAITSVVNTLFDTDLSGSVGVTVAWGLGLFVWTFLYWWYPLTTFGKTVGMGLVGLEVVRQDGTRLHAKAAAIRTLFMPVSFFFWLGLIPIVTSRNHHAFHDWVAKTSVVYDWPANEPRYLAGRSASTAVPVVGPPVEDLGGPST
jgi:uncharacterized RDD family membrane protein YckC